jgi:dTDP-4-amino-4,6-dideoxygalactose transaminase
LKDEETTLRVIRNLEANRISPRRYFYPSLNTVPLYAGSELPVSEAISKRIICLPLYHTLSTEEINFISRIILRASKYGS